VKILDFGLAKAWQHEEGDPDLSHSPTLTAQMTSAGVLLGTAAYMSPEQARGRPVDRRADLWAFGCILYEMLTGRRLFGGDTVSDVVAGVLKGDLDLETVPSDTPPPVRRVLDRCLRRDPAHRLRDIGDAILELEEHEEPPNAAAPPRNVAMQRAAWTVAIAAVVFATALAWRLTTAPEPREVATFEIVPPASTEFAFDGDLASPPVMSPDGSMVLFGAAAPGEPVSLWVRSLRTGEARRLPGTDGGFAPFWSPDARSIGFFDLTSLRRVDLAGGSPLTLCTGGISRGGVWTKHDDIIFAPDYNAGLHVIPATGGEARQLTSPIEGRHTSHRWPALLPDGERLVYLAISHASRQSEDNELRIMGIDGRNDRPLVPTLANGVVVAGRLLFMRVQTLMAQRLDARRATLIGEPRIVARDVYHDPDTWHAAFCAVGDTLLYQASHGREGAGVTLIDLEGRVLGTAGEASFYGAIDASPDGRRVAVSVGSPSDIWIIDLESGLRTRLTFGPTSATSPLWSADGSEIFYRSFDAENPSQILAKPSSGAGEPRIVLDDPDLLLQPADVSPDGRYLILEDAFYAVGADIWVLDLEREGPPRPLIERPGTQTQVSISPDGRWLVYWSDESGGLQGYVEPFLPEPLEDGSPGRSGRWEVSAETAGGSPHWSSDGTKLLHLTLDRRLVAVDVEIDGDTVHIGERRVICQTNASSSLRAWDVVPGSDTIVVINQPAGAGTPITAVIGLRRLLAEAER
jgi:Tol biopolymer transport system component